WRELGHRALDRRIGQPDRELLVARDAEAAGPDHPDAVVAVGTGAGGNDQQLVPARQQPVGYVANRIRDAVDLRQEGFGDHHYAHSWRVPRPGELVATGA